MKAIIIDSGNLCPKCSMPMERRKHPIGWVPKKAKYYFSEWDYCNRCLHVQHYGKFKKKLIK